VWYTPCTESFRGESKWKHKLLHLRLFVLTPRFFGPVPAISFGAVWCCLFSQGSRGKTEAWWGLLDAGVHAVPHRHLSIDWTDVVQRLGKAPFIWRAWRSRLMEFTGLRWPIADTSIELAAGWLDGNRVPALSSWP
jgi:hypothetical protein